MIKRKYIIFIIIGIIVCIYLIALLVKLIKKPTETFVVEKGKIYQEEFAEGYVIRDETIINKEETNEKIVPIKSEGEKVANGEAIYRYCTSNEEEINNKIEEIDIEIQKNLSNDDTYFSSDVKLINNQIDKKLDEIYESNNLKNINQDKSEINTYLTKKMKIRAKNSNNETLKKLVNERTSYENKLNNSSRYRIDGLEESLKTGDFSYLNEQYLNSLDIQTGQIVALSNTSSKIVDNFQCDIVCILDSEEARNSEVGKSIKLRLQNSEEVPAKILYKATEKNNKVLLVFEINNDVAELIKYRKTSFDVIWWSDSGLKIPNSAIKYDGNIAYVIRNRSGLKEKILVKILRSNDKYSIVENYSYAELKEAGYDTSGISNKKSISIFDQIEN